MKPAGGTLLGMSRTLAGGRTVAHEFLRIEEHEGQVTLVARPSGQPEASFKMIQSGASALALTLLSKGPHVPVGVVEHFWDFVGALISVFTYGMILVIYSVPFGLLHGLGAGLLILKLDGRSSSDQA